MIKPCMSCGEDRRLPPSSRCLHQSNHYSTMTYKPCIGYGPYEGKCKNKSYIKPFLWCERCEKLRIETISKQFKSINKEFNK